MVTELYKRIDGELQYWRAGCRGETVVVHAGKVGDTGEVREIAPVPGQSAADSLKRESGRARGRGYVELDEDALIQLVVQYQIDGMGSEDDVDRRHQVEEILGERLGSTGNGYCDGGDIGSGTMNVFCYVIVPEIAAQSVCSALQGEQMIDGATIATWSEDENYEVIWPAGFDGVFTLM